MLARTTSSDRFSIRFCSDSGVALTTPTGSPRSPLRHVERRVSVPGQIQSVVTPAGRFAYDRLHYSEAILADGFVFCSGVIGTGDKGRLPDDVEEEFDLAWRKVDALLTEAGSSLAGIVECTTYHVGLNEHIGVFSRVRDRYLAEPWPAWTAIGISELAVPGAHVEIRVTARVTAE